MRVRKTKGGEKMLTSTKTEQQRTEQKEEREAKYRAVQLTGNKSIFFFLFNAKTPFDRNKWLFCTFGLFALNQHFREKC